MKNRRFPWENVICLGIIALITFFGLASEMDWDFEWFDRKPAVVMQAPSIFTEVRDLSLIKTTGQAYTQPLSDNEKVYFSYLGIHDTFINLQKIEQADDYRNAGNDCIIMYYDEYYILLQSGTYKFFAGTVIYMAPQRETYHRHYHRMGRYWRGGTFRSRDYDGSSFRGGGPDSGK